MATTYNSVMSALVSNIICIPFVRRPFQKLNDPSYYGLDRTEYHLIPTPHSTQPDEGLGAWLMRPMGVEEDKLEIGADAKVILYLHGNAASRSQKHRVQLYKILQDLGVYVLAFDYRGFADSAKDVYPNEDTLAEDARTALAWLRSRAHPEAKIAVIGHSLGTGVAMKMAASIAEAPKSERPRAYMLMAPFNNMHDEVMTFFAGRAVSYFMDIRELLTNTFCRFESDKWIRFVQEEPVVIVHAEDDDTVPYDLGVKLFKKAEEYGCSVSMVSYKAVDSIGHNNFVDDRDLPNKLRGFLSRL